MTKRTQAGVLAKLSGKTSTDLVDGLDLYGIGRTAGYELAARDELPFPVFRLGRKYVVPVAPLLKSLGLEPTIGPL